MTEGWAPVSAPLPTYISKPAAPRRVITTLDLDATGVWTSGRSEVDSAIARAAEAEEAAARTAPAVSAGRRATGA